MMPYPGTRHAPNPIPGKNDYVIQKGAYPYEVQYSPGGRRHDLALGRGCLAISCPVIPD